MINSAHNQQIKAIQALNKYRKERIKTGLFVTEGVKIFKETPRQLIEKVYVSEAFSNENKSLIDGLSYEVIEDSLFFRICDTKTPQGILCVLKQPVYNRDAILGSSGTPFILLLEDVQDPGNVGTIIRTAEGAGVSGIILSRGCADIFQPKTIRSTMGSIFRVPFVIEDDMAAAAEFLAANNIHTYGAHLNGTVSYSEPDYTKGTAFFIGNEGNGLSDFLSKRCDTLIRIPMEGKLESLNAAVASAILMYSVHEKRSR